jgi:hypothetical protein
MWVRSGRGYGLCSSVSLWLGQRIAVCRRGIKAQRKIFCSTLPTQFSEEPRKIMVSIRYNLSHPDISCIMLQVDGIYIDIF